MIYAQSQRSWLRAFFTALQFLTRIPIPQAVSAEQSNFLEDTKRSLVFYPLIGGIVGSATAATLWLSHIFWPPVVAVLLALLAEALITGAMHEDAVADFCDAFGGGTSREDTIRILEDSRIGSFGLLGLGLLLALRAATLVSIEDSYLMVLALVVSGALSRFTMLVTIATVPIVEGRDSLAAQISAQLTYKEITISALIVFPLLIWCAWLRPFEFIFMSLVIIFFLRAFFQTLQFRLQGCTGDCVGAAGYMVNVLVTLFFAIEI